MTGTDIKKDFSDWLVVTDIDGTLRNKLRFLPKRNYEAIREFVEEKHGKFTLASGRNVKSIISPYNSLPMIKGMPVVILNGAGVYDVENDKILNFEPISQEGKLLLRETIERFPKLEVEILTPRSAYAINAKIFARLMLKFDGVPNKLYKSFDDVPDDEWGKMILFGPPPLVSKAKSFLLGIDNPPVSFMSSSISSFEMTAKGVNKGTSVLKIAEMLGIEWKHTAAIGDYFNDYEMLKAVNLSACCGQAPKELHKIVKYEACHCNYGAVGDLLEYLMYRYKE
ncbi:MAG: HAD hydrolase family protein [Clostridia bacterium]|nr:HAD hydrolase family protein [Clostridia bacterium]